MLLLKYVIISSKLFSVFEFWILFCWSKIFLLGWEASDDISKYQPEEHPGGRREGPDYFPWDDTQTLLEGNK